MRPFTIKMPEHLEARIERLARERGVSRGAIVREALEAYASRAPSSARELAGDLVGSIRRGPRDLSRNPKHLDDFGA